MGTHRAGVVAVILVLGWLGGCRREPSQPLPMPATGCNALLPYPDTARSSVRRALRPASGLPAGTGALVLEAVEASPTRDAVWGLWVGVVEGPPGRTGRGLGAESQGGGVYLADTLPAGRYHLLLRRIGLVEFRSTLEVRAGFVDTVEVRLARARTCLYHVRSGRSSAPAA